MAKIDKDTSGLALHVIKRDAKLKRVQVMYEEHSRLQYKLPSPLAEFEHIRPVISSSPYLALMGSTRALSNLQDALEIHPITVLGALKGPVDDQSKAAAILANQWETALRWQLQRASGRGRPPFSSDAVWSVSVYDEVIARLIHLPTEFKAKSIGKREKSALRFGDWALRIEDVKSVYPTYSEYMLESVLSVNIKTAEQLVNSHGKAADFIDAEIGDDKEGADELYVEFDLVDIDGRVIWVSKGINVQNTEGEIILPREPWLKDLNGDQVPFLNWIGSRGGTSVDQAPEFQIKPILFPVLMTEAWAVANISGTLMMSNQLAQASGDTTDVFVGPGADAIEEDWTTPRRRLNLNIGQTYQRLESSGLDKGFREVYDRLDASIQRSTVAEVLVTAQPISGEQAFASYDLQVRQALASLGGTKATAERFFASVFETMLLITHYTGGQITGYGKGLEKYTIDSEDITPEAIYLSVELKPDVPTDRLQRATAAVQIVDKLPYSPQRLLKMLGETDPEGSLREWKLWQLEVTDFQAKLQRLQSELSGQYEQDVLAAAQAMVEQQMAQMGPPAAGENGRTPEGALGGQEFNPAAGGTPPAMASPAGTTFEGATGMTRGGGEIG